MTTPEPEAADPWAEPDWRPGLAPPMSDAFYRAIGDYCRAENAKAEAVPGPEPATPQGYAAWIPDPVPSLDDPRYRGLGGWRPDGPGTGPRGREPGTGEIRPAEPEPDPEAGR